jgi:hypothetical protein
MIKEPLILAALLVSRTALANFGPSSLAEVFVESDRVVEAYIISAKVVTLSTGFRDDSCGYIYEAKVGETFKGRHAARIRFASNEAMTPASRHILFLQSYDGDFPSDVAITYVDPKTNKTVDARAGCAKALLHLKSNYLHTAEFLPYEFVKLSRWITPPPDMRLDMASVKRTQTRFGGDASNVVEWKALRGALVSLAQAQPALPIHSGEYTFWHRDEEFPDSRGFRVRVSIKGMQIVLINPKVHGPFPAGVIDEGTIQWHARSKQWILAHDAAARDASELGCAGGPSTIDFAKRIIWTCEGGP